MRGSKRCTYILAGYSKNEVNWSIPAPLILGLPLQSKFQLGQLRLWGGHRVPNGQEVLRIVKA